MAPKRKTAAASMKAPPAKKNRQADSEDPEVTDNGKTVTSSLEEAQKVTNGEKRHFLIKSEPESRLQDGHEMKFSFDDLKARNIMRDQMRAGDSAFFYHSNCKEPGIVGIVEIVKDAYVDHTQFDKNDPHYDAASKPGNPRWFMVDVKYVRPLKRFVGLRELKESTAPELKDLVLTNRGRLSVQPVKPVEWDYILKLSEQPQPK